MEKGGKYMGNKREVNILRSDDNNSLEFKLKSGDVIINLTEEAPNKIKMVFNSILRELKDELFSFELQDEKKDLCHEIAEEYIKQLNKEMETVYKELE